MSRINDALKRAQAAQQSPLPHSGTPQSHPGVPEQTATRGIGLAVPFVFVLIAILGLFFLWQIRQKRAGQNQAPAAAPSGGVAISTPQKTPEPAVPDRVAAVSMPKPTVSPSVREKPIAQTSVPRAPVARSVASSAKSAAPGPPPLKLQGVLFAGKKSSAMINGQSVMAGDNVGEYRVSAIYERSVTLINAKRTNILTLNQ